MLDRAGAPAALALKSRLHFDNFESMIDAAIKGLGIACLPDWIVRPAQASGLLVHLLEDHPVETRGVYAVWPQAPTMPSSLRLAIDALAARLPDRLAGT